MLFCLSSLVSTRIFRAAPWDYEAPDRLPEEVRKDKTARNSWINSPARKWCCYSTFEGVNEGLRIRKSNGDEEGNPPYKLHGWAVDIDEPIPADELVRRLDSIKPFRPHRIEKTLSGNWRPVFLFDEPLLLPSYEFAIFFQQEILNFIPFHRLSPEFDKNAFTEPNRYYTNSGDWGDFDGNVPQDVVEGFFVQISEKFNWAKHSAGAPAVAIETILPLLREKYPQFDAEWQGDFTLGAQGPTFWIPESSSPMSAIVRETGIQTFSAHAAKAFYTWADLVGAKPLEQHYAANLGKAVEGIYFDGRSYWRKLERGDWKPFTRDDISLHLRVDRGIRSSKAKDEPASQLDRCLSFLHEHAYVEGAGPFVFRPDGLLPNGSLNTATRRVMSPSEGPEEWGPSGNFPTLSRFFDGFFSSPEQLPHFLAWFRWAYEGFYNLSAQPGQVIVIAGKAAVGKTFLNRGILGTAFGGYADAQPYLTGQDSFNVELFNAGHWPVDDSSAAASNSRHRLWTEALKRAVANSTHRANEKFRTASMVEWMGRICITCNDDEESMRILPDLGVSNMDKVALFIAAEKPAIEFEDTFQARVALIKRELPHLLRWLLDWDIPEHVLDRGQRFGIKPFHHESLVRRAHLSSPASSFIDLIEDWKSEYFNIRNPEAEHWEGTGLQLHKEMDLAGLSAPLRDYSVQRIGQMLATVKNQGYPISIIDKGDRRFYRIFRGGGS